MEITESEKERLIYAAVSDLETDMMTVIETCQPVGLPMRDYTTCVTLALAYVIEGMADVTSRVKGEEMTFDRLMGHISAAHEKALKYREVKK